MKNITILILVLITVLQTTYIIAGSDDKEDLKAVVDALGSQAEQCFLTGRIDDMLEFYCDDIISMPEFYPMLKGRQNLKRKTEAIMAMGLKFETLESTTLEAQSSGDLVYEIGTFRQSIIMPNTTEPTTQTGKYLTIWKRQPDGKLKIAVEMYNSDTNPFQNQMTKQ